MLRYRWLAMALAAVFVGAALAAAHGGGAEAVAYRHAAVERGDVLATVAATGTLAPVATVQVGSEITGQLKEVYADFNSEVRQGDPLALIEPTSFQIAVEQAQAELDMARAAVEVQRAIIQRLRSDLAAVRHDLRSTRAEVDAARFTAETAGVEADRADALGPGISSDAERGRARTEQRVAGAQLRALESAEARQRALVESATAQLRAAQTEVNNLEAVVRQRAAGLRRAQFELERTVIRAPVDGIVIQREVEAGQTVATSFEAPTLFTLAQDLGAMQVDAAIDESEIGRIALGQSVEFTVDAHYGQRFTGVVEQIRKSPQEEKHVVTYTVVVTAQNPDQLLLPGMTASARFIIDERENVMKVPNAALRFTPVDVEAAAQPRVWVQDGRELRAIPVQVGLRDESHTEVAGVGLEEGLRVVIGEETDEASGNRRLLGGR